MNSNAQKPGLLCAHPVQVSDSREKHPQQQEALLEQISRARATISLECPLRRGATVSIDCGTCELRGKVAGCRFAGYAYMADIDLPAGSQWSPDQFRPNHLFNAQSMVCEQLGCTPDCVGESCAKPETHSPRRENP
ncbi:MAG: hypothetical protein A3F68_04835 [Acidobacteria bacterium RIFCSPLOWO2_12_FULL_54_10]|nr:MAG: hypothetical protein A3F68_04835 [Acidobacteria bacterium RIFCSPLOWO2_12_FULL_54_10]